MSGQQGMGVASTTVVEQLVERACDRAGLDDLGADAWREGLSILVDSIETTPGVIPGGREDLYGRFVDALVEPPAGRRPLEATSRGRRVSGSNARLSSWDFPARDHRGQLPPRPGPGRRSLLNWEAGDSVPPATTGDAAYRSPLPRQEGGARRLAARARGRPLPDLPLGGGRRPHRVHVRAEPGFQGPAVGGVHADPRVRGLVPRRRPDERLRVRALGAPGAAVVGAGLWSLKMPSHAVHVDALLAIFPDARLLWAHRDPYKATASALRMYDLARAVLGAESTRRIVASCCGSCRPTSTDRCACSSASAPTLLPPPLRRPHAGPDRADARAVRMGRRRADPGRTGDAGLARQPPGPVRARPTHSTSTA